MVDYKKIKKNRMAEKRGEFLGDANERFRKGRIEDGLSLLSAAAEEYEAKYSAIKVTLDNAKSSGFLPKDFEVPDDIKRFKELYSKPKRKGKYKWET